ncbi:hypothetical protein N0V88_007949 [Collariella sp. IMI 366227]|nr:hypothetical protein N0V88_007949 [Collariella sp. IMI 366227]
MTPEAEKVDVLICGSGSAGLCAAVWLARFGINYKILEKRDGPLKIGQADGVQTRTVEIFDSFGIAEDLLKESYHVLEVAFWSHLEAAKEGIDGIKRTRYSMDKETEVSHQPHVILNQARLNAMMMEELKKGVVAQPVEYECEVKGVEVDDAAAKDQDTYPVRVTAVTDGKEKIYQAKYVLGCDGAHSIIRRSLGYKMVGDSTDSVWGVMDIFPQTEYPDIRKKCVINSAAGSILIVPREGDSMVRFYTELPEGTKVSDVSLERLQNHARLVFKPYKMDFAETAWWSAYAIGQRRADFFHKNHRVFLTGDACHTHSPKAGQGMNVSLQDGYNIGWKLGMVLKGLARPELIETYVLERERTATELIEFDRGFTKLFNSKYREENNVTPQMVSDQFVKAGSYTAGQAVRYDPSAVTVVGEQDKEIAAKVTVGMRFPSAQVVRFCDAKAMQLVKGLPADGQWYVVSYGVVAHITQVAQLLEETAKRFTPSGAYPDSVIDRVLVIASDRMKVEQEEIPAFFTPVTGKWAMKCLNKVYADDESYNSGHGHTYEAYGIDPKKGALVVVRPDHYVAKVAALEEPMLRSVELMQPDSNVFESADVVSNSSNLHKLFYLLKNTHKMEERYDLEMRGKTLLLSRWHADHARSNSFGCGAGFERDTAQYGSEDDPVLQQSESHHRVVSYDFGGLRCVVQSEADAYYCHCNHSQNSKPAKPPKHKKIHSDPLSMRRTSPRNTSTKPLSRSPVTAFAALTLDDPGDTPAFAARDQATVRTTTTSDTLKVHHTGRNIPCSCLIELKTQKIENKPLYPPETQLYFTRRMKLYVAYHKKGVFFHGPDLAVEDVRDRLRTWERREQATLRKLNE